MFQNAVVRSRGDKQTYYGHEIPLCRDRSTLHYRLPLEKVQYPEDITPVSSAHPRQGICGRLGCAKSDLGRDVPPIPQGKSPLLSVTRHHLQHGLHQADISESSILITEPYFNLPQIQRIYDQFVFEEYGFQSYYRCTRPCILHPKQQIRTNLTATSCITDPPWFIVHRTTQNSGRSLTPAPRMRVGHRLGLQLHAHRTAHFGIDRLERCEKVQRISSHLRT